VSGRETSPAIEGSHHPATGRAPSQNISVAASAARAWCGSCLTRRNRELLVGQRQRWRGYPARVDVWGPQLMADASKDRELCAIKSGTDYRVPTTDDAHAGGQGAAPFRDGVDASSKGAPARARHSKGSIVDTRIIDRPAFRLVGYAARVPLVHQGGILTSRRTSRRCRLRSAGGSKHSVTPNRQACSRSAQTLTPTMGGQPVHVLVRRRPRHTVACDGLDLIEVPTGRWAVFRTTASLQSA
jgi:hypothetical protein